MPLELSRTAPISWRPSPLLLRRIVEGVLVIMLAGQTARLAWALATPAGPLGEPSSPAQPSAYAPPPDLSVLERFAPAPIAPPTGLIPGAPLAEAAPAISGYSLHGVRSAMFGDRGSAIISGPDGRQNSYRVGERVGPGVVLTAVGRDAATLSGSGGSARLEIGAAASPATGPAPGPPAPAPGPGLVLPPAPVLQAPDLLGRTVLTPRRENGRVTGVTVQARGGPQGLQQAGLQPGDVLLSVNGRQLDSPERQSEIASELAGADGAEIRFERNGQIMTTRVRTSR